VATETLQQNTLGTVKDFTSSGSGIVSAFENLGLNFAGALGSIGIAKLAQSAGVSGTSLRQGSTSLLSPTAQIQQVQVARAGQTNWMAFGVVILGVAALGGVIAYAARQRR